MVYTRNKTNEEVDHGYSFAIRERILELSHEKGCTIHGLAVRTAMSQSTIRNFINEKTSDTEMITINLICDSFDISSIGEIIQLTS